MKIFLLINLYILINISLQRGPEDAIPVIEIRGEGPPMSSAQIRDLEERANGKPLDIKIEKLFIPKECKEKVENHDWVTFNYKGFTEDGKLFDTTYNNKSPVTIQMSIGMSMIGLEKGMIGMCIDERRRIKIPWRLSKKVESKVWKLFPTEEHWISLEVEVISIDKWSIEKQFNELDHNIDGVIDLNDMIKTSQKLEDYGKRWSNNDIDNVIAGKYFIKYFDIDKNNKIEKNEYFKIMKRDMKVMKNSNPIRDKKGEFIGKRREPGFGWILDHNNDGYIQPQENYEADKIFEKSLPIREPIDNFKEEL
ncbi:Fkbp13 [Strongyloides ratti]|uniref:peptidylprolyl isomerase n=1 Tax=Strongyloides ratti TaxID=34506 RepID=A0A090LJ93_STRRB|nr:Fkbp13 [Strongyloides ratti]CEF67610.1 Fkbp13 [Strongyloides ratti]